MTSFLRDYGHSRAVLVGAWDYDNLSPVAAARHSLDRMERVLTGPLCGWPADRVETVRNPRRRGELPDRLMELYDGVADVALFYFVGHGQRHGDELCLALCESPDAGPRRMTTGLAFSDVRAALRECDALTKIVVLDCCFSGQATESGHSLAGADPDLATLTAGTGAFTMTASGAFRTAWFDADPHAVRPQTYFTRYLLDSLEEGLPGGSGEVTLGPLFVATAEALARDRRPEPTRSVRHDADRFVLARHGALGAAVADAVAETVAKAAEEQADAEVAVTPAPGETAVRRGRWHYQEVVLEYFANLPPDTPRAVRQIEEDLGLPGKTLAGFMNEMAKDPECPLYRADAEYTGSGTARKQWYRGFACGPQA